MTEKEQVLKDAVIRYLEEQEKVDPDFKLILGKESLTAAQIREKLNDPEFWGEIREWADALAVDMFNEGRKKIAGNTSTP